MMELTYDGVFIGAGHNSMIAAGYLARSGLKVALAEQALELGGGLDAHENPRYPGFWHNIHSFHHRGVTELPWYRDLELARHGGDYIRMQVSNTMLFRDGRSILWYSLDPERTAAQFAKFSQKDAATFLELNRRFARVASDIFAPENYAPPLPMEEKRALLERSEIGRAYLEYARHSIRDVILSHFESDQVRCFLAYLAVMRAYEIDVPGVGHYVPCSIASGLDAQLCRGTSHRLAHVLHRAVVRAGGDFYEAQAVRRILMENGAACGVELADGRRIYARRFVASSLNPQQTFLEMVGREMLEPAFAEKVAGFRYSTTTPLFTTHLALSEPPRFLAAEREPDIYKSLTIFAGFDGFQDIDDLYQDCRRGGLPRKLSFVAGIPSLHDRTVAPAGQHIAFLWQIAPGDLSPEEGGPERWDAIRDEFMEREIELLHEFAPNMGGSAILDAYALTPHDIQRHLPHMVGGDIVVGEMNEQQIFDRRPFPECSQYRTPVKGLYLCGSSCHPGGNITGGPGYNAAGVLADDLGVPKWWDPRDLRQFWSALP